MKKYPLLLPLFILNLFLILSPVTVGSPTNETKLAVFPDATRFEKLVDTMVKMREEVYSYYAETLKKGWAILANDNYDESKFKKVIVETPLGPVPRWEIDKARAFLLVNDFVEDSATIRSFHEMNQSRWHINYKSFKYGGTYIYPAAGVLWISSKLGFVVLTNDIAFYLRNSPQAGRILNIPKIFFGFLVSCSIFVLYFLGKLIVNQRTGLYAAALSTGLFSLVITSRYLAPHAYLFFTTSVALATLGYALKSKTGRSTFLAGMGAGLAVGTDWLGGCILPFLFFYVIFTFKEKKLNRLVLCGAGILVTLLFTNPAWFLYPADHWSALRGMLEWQSDFKGIGSPTNPVGYLQRLWELLFITIPNNIGWANLLGFLATLFIFRKDTIVKVVGWGVVSNLLVFPILFITVYGKWANGVFAAIPFLAAMSFDKLHNKKPITAIFLLTVLQIPMLVNSYTLGSGLHQLHQNEIQLGLHLNELKSKGNKLLFIPHREHKRIPPFDLFSFQIDRHYLSMENQNWRRINEMVRESKPKHILLCLHQVTPAPTDIPGYRLLGQSGKTFIFEPLLTHETKELLGMNCTLWTK